MPEWVKETAGKYNVATADPIVIHTGLEKEIIAQRHEMGHIFSAVCPGVATNFSIEQMLSCIRRRMKRLEQYEDDEEETCYTCDKPLGAVILEGWGHPVCPVCYELWRIETSDE